MKIVYMGTPLFAVPPLKALAALDGVEISGVVTRPDRPRGRGQQVRPCPVKEASQELGLQVFQPERIKDESFLSVLEGLAPDLVVVAAYGQILPDSILFLPSLGCINAHASILPGYRGAAPIQRAIMNGEKKTGVTIMKIDSGLDTGDVIISESIALGEDESFASVHDRLSLLAARLLAETVLLMRSGPVPAVPQENRLATYAPPIKREEEIIDWGRTAAEIKNQVRAMDPWPGARTWLDGKVLKIWRVQLHDGASGDSPAAYAPGRVLETEKGLLLVQCGSGSVNIVEIQAEGGRRLPCDLFLRGCRCLPGTVLGLKQV